MDIAPSNEQFPRQKHCDSDYVILSLENKVALLQAEVNRLQKNLSYYRSELKRLRDNLNNVQVATKEYDVNCCPSTRTSMTDCVEGATTFTSVLATYCTTGILDAFLTRSCKRLPQLSGTKSFLEDA
ncbi:hypothetical protein ACA910_011167 [Epithemia clementina (nom. ined.)]